MEAHKLYPKETYQPPRPRIATRKRWRFRWKPGSVLLLVLLGYILFSFGQVYYSIYQLNTEKASLEQELNQLIQENQALHREAELSQSDQYIERLAREELGLVKPGETVMIPSLPGDVRQLQETDSNKEILH